MQKIDHIPKSVMRSMKIKKLINERYQLLELYKINSRRINPTNPHRSRIEKDRTKRRKILTMSIRENARELMFLLEKIVKHPDIYVPDGKGMADPIDRGTYSEYRTLIRRWKQWSPPPKAMLFRKGYDKNKPEANQHFTKQSIVVRIMDMETAWLNAVQRRCFPTKPLPPKWSIHPSRFHP